MEVWALLFIFLLIIAIGILIYFNFDQSSSNTKVDISKNLLPFNVTYNALNRKTSSGGVVKVVNSLGQPQIKCPPGFKINIVGAFSQVVDPFGECTPTPSATFKNSCGDTSDNSSLISCNSDSDCNGGMVCSQGKCIPSQCSVDSDGVPSLTNGNTSNVNMCPSQPGVSCDSTNNNCLGANNEQITQCGNNGECTVNPVFGSCMACSTPGGGVSRNYPLCSNINSSYQNNICRPGGSGGCKLRDISAYVANYCDGKQECDITWDLTSPEAFGPLPCNLQYNNNNFLNLPIIPGWNGSTPENGSQPSPASSSQGYNVHGIFTCVPDDS